MSAGGAAQRFNLGIDGASDRAALDQMIQMQAAIISYIDDFKLMMILSLAAIPLVLLLRRAPAMTDSDHAMAIE
jgi:DHA2 family multidrug resistance protein